MLICWVAFNRRTRKLTGWYGWECKRIVFGDVPNVICFSCNCMKKRVNVKKIAGHIFFLARRGVPDSSTLKMAGYLGWYTVGNEWR